MGIHPRYQYLFIDHAFSLFLEGPHLWTRFDRSEYAFKRTASCGGHGPGFLVIFSQFISGF